MVEQQDSAVTQAGTAPVEGVPAWVRTSLFQWLNPLLHATQDGQYDHFSGEPSSAFLMLTERRLQLTLDWRYGKRGAIENLAARMDADEELFLRVLELAVENVHLGYSFQTQDEALAELDRILTEAGMAIRLDIQRVETGEQWHGHPMYRDIRTLQRRTSEETAAAVHAVSEQASEPGKHLSAAWNHAYGRNPDPRSAYREAVMAVEAASIPIVSPNNAKATLGTVIGDLRSAP